MRSISTLDKQLLHEHFNRARAVYDQARAAGHPPVKVAALVYASGFYDGADVERAKTKKAYQEVGALKDSIKQNDMLADLINNPAPDRPLPEWALLPDESPNSPTPGEQQEGTKNE